MPSITIELSQQELDTITLAAYIRKTPIIDNAISWRDFYGPWHLDAKQQVDKEASAIIANNPELAAQIMTMLQAQIAGG